MWLILTLVDSFFCPPGKFHVKKMKAAVKKSKKIIDVKKRVSLALAMAKE